jgi:APA family basic amino acid/polyamine antiporter
VGWQGHRGCRDDLDLRRPERLDPAPGPRSAGSRPGRALPEAVRAVDGKRGTPVFGLVLSSVLITGLLLLNLQSSGTIVDWFTDIIIIATLTALIPYMLAAAAQLYLFFTDRAAFSGVHFARYSVVAVLALAYSTWAIWGAGADPVRKGLMLLIAGIPVFLWTRWRQSKTPKLPLPVEPAPPPAERPTVAAPLR